MSVRFERPASLAEATHLLAGGGWQVLAGGTDVYPAQVGRPPRAPLLDITGIAGLRGIRRTAGGWSIGAATTWTDVLRADLPPLFDALKQAAREVGGVQVQNMGTVAGNLCNASPAADGVPVLMALDAEVVLRSGEGERRCPAVDFVLGSRRTACAPHELVVALEVPARSARARSVFRKLGGRRYLTISMTMVAVVLDVDAAGVVAARRRRGRQLLGGRAAPARARAAPRRPHVVRCARRRARRARRAGRPRAAHADRRPARERGLPARRQRHAAAPRAAGAAAA